MAEATCEKCDKYYEDPRMLPCLHSFCLGCLEKELETQETQSSLHCPSCKEKVTLSENGVSGLPQDLHKANEAEITRISEKVEDADEYCDNCGRTDTTGKAVAYCIECEEYLCTFCEGKHGKKKLTANHSLVTIGQRLVKTTGASSVSRFYQQPVPCPLHKYNLEIYCKQCKMLICNNCMFKHRDHQEQCDLVEEVAKQEMESLKACQVDTEGAVASLDAAIAKCKETMEKVEARKKAVDTAITNSLEQVRKALLAQNEKICSGKIVGLEAQVHQLQRVRDGLSLASTMIAEAQSHSPAQLLSTKKVLAERATMLQKEFKDSNLLPSQSANFVTNISDPATVSKMISLGCVSGGNGHPASSTCTAGYLPRAVVSKLCTIKVVAKDKQGKQLSKGGDEVEAKLVQTDSQGPPVTGKAIDHGDGTYSVSVTPQTVGEYELHVTLAGSHLKGSPFQYSVTKPRATAYTALSAQYPISSYNYPWDVAVTEEGNIAVAEFGYQSVSLYSVTGQRIHSFGTPNSCGSGDGQFHSPSGVAIRGDLMYVSDTSNNRVQKFSVSKRSFISKFGSSGKGKGQFSSPRGICIDPEGKVFIADQNNTCIQVFNEDDSFAYSFPCQPSPLGLAFDHQGHLHVAVYSSHCVQVFTPEGTPITSYGSGTLNLPAGIAIDAQGYIAIGEDSGNNRLWIYSPDHNLVHTLSGQFRCGMGIACDKDGFFWVADHSNSRIAKY